MARDNISELATEEIVQRIGEERERYVKLKFNHQISPMENPLELRHLRKLIARLGTELRKREIADASALKL